MAKLTQMAQLPQERALDLLRQGDADGWTDLEAAVTAWGEAGAKTEAEHVLDVGRQFAAALAHGRANVEGQLNEREKNLGDGRFAARWGCATQFGFSWANRTP